MQENLIEKDTPTLETQNWYSCKQTSENIPTEQIDKKKLYYFRQEIIVGT